MQILRRPIQENTFDDVVAFCVEGVIEGIELDYKKDLSDKGLAKHFAAFSNARGGLIIIGVEEDTSTGRPIRYEGVDEGGKIEDRIHQYAGNVDPIPRYEVFTTPKNSDNKVFVLVRIFEGDRTPYFVLNDATIYLRNGNSTKRCEEPASPQEMARLFEKKNSARLARDLNLQRAEEIYTSAIERFKKQNGQPQNARDAYLGLSDVEVPIQGIFTVALQPHFPDRTLVSPRKLYSHINGYSSDFDIQYCWLNRSGETEAMQDGVLTENKEIGINPRFIECQQFFSNGLVFGRNSRATQTPRQISEDSSEFVIRLESIVCDIYNFLVFSRLVYQLLGYQGGLNGYIELNQLSGMKSLSFSPAWEYRSSPKEILLSSYQ